MKPRTRVADSATHRARPSDARRLMMHPVGIALALLVMLTGCIPIAHTPQASLYYTPAPADPADGYSPDFDATSTMPAEDAADLGQPADPAPAPSTLPPPEAPMLAQQRAACARDGGRLTARGGELFVCVHQTRDGGRQCIAAAECEGVCLARSRSCAPLRPLLGCQQVFTLPGRRETLCTD